MRKWIFTFVFFACILTAQAQNRPVTTADVIGSWWNGMEMGGTTLEIKRDYTYTITDDHMGEVIEEGRWQYTTDRKLTLTTKAGVVSRFWFWTGAKVEGRSNICLTYNTGNYRGMKYGNVEICYFRSQQ